MRSDSSWQSCLLSFASVRSWATTASTLAAMTMLMLHVPFVGADGVGVAGDGALGGGDGGGGGEEGGKQP